MRSEIVRFILGGLFAAFAVFSSSAALAQSDDDGRARARAEFDRGVELYRLEQWQPALAAFQEAYRLRPHPTVRVNMANCYEHLSRPMEAIFHFERYLSEMGRNAPAPQRREVEASLTRLRRSVGELVMQVSPDGAVVRIDDAEERRAPILEPVRLVAGPHNIAIRLDGYESVTRAITVEGGASATVTVSLERARPQVAAAPTTTRAPNATSSSATSTTALPTESPRQQGEGLRTELPRPDPRRRRTDDTDLANADFTSQVRAQHEEPASVEAQSTSGSANDDGGSSSSTAMWVAGGVTVAMLGGAIATGVLALSADSDFDAAVARSNDGSLSVDERNQAIADGNAAADRAGTLALVSDILSVGAVLGAVTTVVLYFTSKPGDDERSPAQSAFRASPWLSSDRAGVMLEGAF